MGRESARSLFIIPITYLWKKLSSPVLGGGFLSSGFCPTRSLGREKAGKKCEGGREMPVGGGGGGSGGSCKKKGGGGIGKQGLTERESSYSYRVGY